MRWTRSLPPDDLVLFVDGTDVLYAGCGAPPPPTAPTDGLQPPRDGRSDDAAARVRGAYRALSERLTRVMGAANASLVVGAELGAFDTLVVGAQASRAGDDVVTWRDPELAAPNQRRRKEHESPPPRAT